MTMATIYCGDRFTIEETADRQFVFSPDSAADEVYDSLEELTEAHPDCNTEEILGAFYGLMCPECGVRVDPQPDHDGIGCHCPDCGTNL